MFPNSKNVELRKILHCYLLTENAHVTFGENPQNITNKDTKHGYLIHT